MPTVSTLFYLVVVWWSLIGPVSFGVKPPKILVKVSQIQQTRPENRADSRIALSQWETLQSNAVSHWLGENLESALWWYHHNRTKYTTTACIFYGMYSIASCQIQIQTILSCCLWCRMWKVTICTTRCLQEASTPCWNLPCCTSESPHSGKPGLQIKNEQLPNKEIHYS